MNTDIKNSYLPSGSKIGTETEHLIINQDNTPLTEENAERFSKTLHRQGLVHSREIYAGVFETKTEAYHPLKIHNVFNEAANHKATLQNLAQSSNKKIATLPFSSKMTLDHAMRYRIKHPRADGLLSHLIATNQSRIAEHCVMTTGIHVSIGYKTLDEALEIANLAARLTPLLTILMENNDGFDKGKRFTGHVMARRRHAQGPRTDIQSYFFKSKNGHDMVEHHINHIFNVAAMMYLDSNGYPQTFTQPKNNNLSALSNSQAITNDNYYFVEKMQYNDVKLAAIKNRDGKVTGHRIELRMADNGMHQHDSMVLIALMLSSRSGRERLDKMLTTFGIDKKNHKRVAQDLNRAIHHSSNHLKQTMSNGQSFHRLAQHFGKELEMFLKKEHPQYLSKARNLLSICTSGMNEAHYKTKRYQKRTQLSDHVM